MMVIAMIEIGSMLAPVLVDMITLLYRHNLGPLDLNVRHHGGTLSVDLSWRQSNMLKLNR